MDTVCMNKAGLVYAVNAALSLITKLEPGRTSAVITVTLFHRPSINHSKRSVSSTRLAKRQLLENPNLVSRLIDSLPFSIKVSPICFNVVTRQHHDTEFYSKNILRPFFMSIVIRSLIGSEWKVYEYIIQLHSAQYSIATVYLTGG